MSIPLTDREIRLLDFYTIREKLASYTITAPGKEKALALVPSSSAVEVKEALQKTSQACRLLENHLFSHQAVPDLRLYLERLEKGGVLGAPELGLFIVFLRNCRHLLNASRKEEVEDNAPALASLMGQISPCQKLLEKLQYSIDTDGEVLDHATSLLKDLRRQKATLQGSIREKLDSYLKSSSYRKYLQEPLVTVRNGRYVIPIKQEYRGQVSGVTHDQSSSGVTVFVEPLPVVEMQNKLQQVVKQEQKEIDRILKELSYLAASYRQDLLDNVEVYAFLDLIMAKGQLSLVTKSLEPEITDEKIIELRGARHPLLEEAVPVDVELGGTVQVLVITGPNTGGKTVTLKTMGLMAAMVQSGLHLPVRPGSRLGVFRGIYADIGDEQSLEQSLSTFSGHLKNILHLVQASDSESLVLLDELGAGTDPSEGAALARAILLDLYGKGSLVASTTHINELKLFAQLEEGMQNASMEFDENTFSPTFRLLQGIPGKSNALAIAERLGLPARILEQARKFLAGGHQEVEKMIGSLTREQQKLREDSRVAAEERNQVETLRRELEEDRERLRQKKEGILKEARQEARSLVKRAKRSADEAILELQQLYRQMEDQQKKGTGPLARAEGIRRHLREELDHAVEDHGEEPEENNLQPGEEDLVEGSYIWVKSLGQKGVILQHYPDHEELLVQVGAVKVNTRISDVQNLKEASSPGKKSAGSSRSYSVRRQQVHVRPEIDLRGLNLSEALEQVDKYIDDALLGGLNQVVLVHGKGTGTLRRGLHEFLKNRQWVENWRLGGSSEGGSGVTVVTLEKENKPEEK